MPEINISFPSQSKKKIERKSINLKDNEKIVSQIMKDIKTYKAFNESYIEALQELPTMRPFTRSIEETFNSLYDIINALLLSDEVDDNTMLKLRREIYENIKEAIQEKDE